MTKKLSLNTFQLKIFALIIMTIDHLGFFNTLTTNSQINSAFRTIGRIAAPIFLFLLTEGLHHTRNKSKYVLRLYVASIITEIINILFITTLAPGYSSSVLGNIFTTFFYVAFYIYFLEQFFEHKKEKKNNLISFLALLIPFIPLLLDTLLNNTSYWHILRIFIPSLLTINYSILFVLIGILWYFIHNKYINCGILAIASLFSLLIPEAALSNSTFNIHTFFVNPQWCMFLAIPFILLYNGEKGKSTKYFFYLYYPLHQYYLFLLYLVTH